VLGGTRFLNEAHAAVDLHADRGDFHADVCRESLRDWRQERGARRCLRAGFGVLGCVRHIELAGGHETDRARRLR